MSEVCEQALQPRRPFQFGLRPLFVGVAIVAIALSWQLRVVQQRKALRASFVARGGRLTRNICHWMGKPTGRPELFPNWRTWLGDKQVDVITVRAELDFSEAELDEARRLFPEADLYILPASQEPFEPTASASP